MISTKAAIHKTVGNNTNSNTTVSYTHLDVYKRQVYSSADKKEIHAFNTLKIPLVEIGNPEKFAIYDENNEYKYTCLLYTSRCV